MRKYSTALYALVAKLKSQLEITCEKSDDSNLAERCKKFISIRTEQWIHNDKFLTVHGVENPQYTPPLLIGIQQSAEFSSKLKFLRGKWEGRRNFASIAKVDGVIEGGGPSEVSKGKRRRRDSDVSISNLKCRYVVVPLDPVQAQD